MISVQYRIMSRLRQNIGKMSYYNSNNSNNNNNAALCKLFFKRNLFVCGAIVEMILYSLDKHKRRSSKRMCDRTIFPVSSVLLQNQRGHQQQNAPELHHIDINSDDVHQSAAATSIVRGCYRIRLSFDNVVKRLYENSLLRPFIVVGLSS